jgi:hypothetical protein
VRVRSYCTESAAKIAVQGMRVREETGITNTKQSYRERSKNSCSGNAGAKERAVETFANAARI